MSQIESVSLPCPQCNHEETLQVWQTLSVVENPEAKTDLFEGKLNIFECHECGLKALVPVPFQYDDSHRELCVQFFPFQLADNREFYSAFAVNGSTVDESVDPAAPEYVRRRHIVFEMSELLRYIVFRERLWGLHHPEEMPIVEPEAEPAVDSGSVTEEVATAAAPDEQAAGAE